MHINTLLASPHAAHLKARVSRWSRSLEIACETLDTWTACQKLWIMLRTAFATRAAPEENAKFVAADRAWKELMRKTYKVNN